MTYVHDTAFFILLIKSNSSDQFRVYPFGKIFLYFDILTWWTWTYDLFHYTQHVILYTYSALHQQFHFLYCFLICFVVSINDAIYFIDAHIFWHNIHMPVELNFKITNKLLSNYELGFIVCWIHFSFIILQSSLYWSIVNLTILIYP